MNRILGSGGLTLLTDVSELLSWCELSCFTQFGSSDFGCAQLQDFDQHTQFVTEQIKISESLAWNRFQCYDFWHHAGCSDVYTIAGPGCNTLRTQSTGIDSSTWAVQMFVFNGVHRGGFSSVCRTYHSVCGTWSIAFAASRAMVVCGHVNEGRECVCVSD